MTDFRSLFNPSMANTLISILGVLAGVFSVIALLLGNVGSSLPTPTPTPDANETTAPIKPGESKQIPRR